MKEKTCSYKQLKESYEFAYKEVSDMSSIITKQIDEEEKNSNSL